MGANVTRSSVLAFKEETTAGTLIVPVAADFVALREGFSVTNELETVTTDELLGGIGQSAPINVGENPAASWAGYLRHSETVGVAPEYGIVIESAMGSENAAAAEYNTVAGSTTTVINVDSGEGASYQIGEALLIQDSVNNFSLRNIESISTDALTLNFTLGVTEPGVGIELGRAILYRPESSGHPTYSLHHYQNTTSAALYQAIAGCRTTSLTLDFPTRDLAMITAEIEGLKYYFDGVTIDATNDDFTITDDGGAVTGSLTQQTYQTPIDLANAVATALSAASVGSGNDAITCVYDSVTGKFTIATDGSTLTLGCNVANSVFVEMGFGTLELSGETTYTAATALAVDPPATPTYDGAEKVVVKHSELLIGDQADNTCRKAINTSFTVATPRTQVKSVCAVNGISETLTLSREATLSTTLVLEQYEAELMYKAINNTTTKIMFNTGPKSSAGNWTVNKCINVYMKNAKIKATVAEEEGYYTLAIEATGFINSSTDKDIYINFI